MVVQVRWLLPPGEHIGLRSGGCMHAHKRDSADQKDNAEEESGEKERGRVREERSERRAE